MRTTIAALTAGVVLAGATALACGSIVDSDDTMLGIIAQRTGFGPDYEVWVVDQSNSRGVAFGGAIHIYSRDALGAVSPVAEVVDLAAATTSLCQAATGAPPVRPHMIFFSAKRTHAVLSFVASGHVVIFDARTRAPVACLRSSPGVGGARQAHAAVPAPNDRYILVANQNGKRLERIDSDFDANTFTFNPAAAIDLTGCTTPSGAPCETPALRPDNAPICPLVDRTSRHAFVTLRGGGLFVVDPTVTPMRIVAEYDLATVRGNGCGGAEVGASMYVNSGGGTMTNLTQFDVYRFQTSEVKSSNAPNAPRPTVVFTDDAGHRDAHGTAVTYNQQYLWVADRAANLIEVFDTQSNNRLPPIPMVGPLSDDPTPDLLDIAPMGDLMFVTLRGPNPLSGDPHVSTGSTPGLAIMSVEDTGRSGVIRTIARISNVDDAGVERADPHGIRVRVK
jgi:DNA-binding beta-propeller fold protein YncE